MAELIQEIPLQAPEATEISEENVEEITNENAESVNIEAPPAKKTRGRPKGSRNRPKEEAAPAATRAAPQANPKAKPKAKPKPKHRPEEYASESSEEEAETVAPRAGRRVRSLDPEAERQAIAAEVLGMLTRQHAAKTAARRGHYAQWFA